MEVGGGADLKVRFLRETGWFHLEEVGEQKVHFQNFERYCLPGHLVKSILEAAS